MYHDDTNCTDPHILHLALPQLAENFNSFLFLRDVEMEKSSIPLPRLPTTTWNSLLGMPFILLVILFIAWSLLWCIKLLLFFVNWNLMTIKTILIPVYPQKSRSSRRENEICFVFTGDFKWSLEKSYQDDSSDVAWEIGKVCATTAPIFCRTLVVFYDALNFRYFS